MLVVADKKIHKQYKNGNKCQSSEKIWDLKMHYGHYGIRKTDLRRHTQTL